MPRKAVVPRLGVRKQVPLKLAPDDAIDLHAFCEAHFGAKQNTVIAEAVRRLIKTDVDRDPELKKRFEDARVRLLEARQLQGVEPIRLIASRTATDDGQ